MIPYLFAMSLFLSTSILHILTLSPTSSASSSIIAQSDLQGRTIEAKK